MKTFRLPLLAAAFLLQTPLVAEIVGNLGNTSDSVSVLNMEGASTAQPFTTGAEAQHLGSITVRLESISGADECIARVKLWSGDADEPETLLEDLGVTSPLESLAEGEYTVHSTLQPLLTANTRYWVSVTNTAGELIWSSTQDTSSTGNGAFVDTQAASPSGDAGIWFNSGGSPFIQLLSVTAIVPPPPPIIVTNANSSGAGSLEQALLDAQPGDTVTFDPAAFNGEPEDTIFSNLLVIENDITVDARNIPAGVTLSGGEQSGILYVKGNATNPVVALHGLTFINADTSAIYNDNGRLSLNRCTLYGNSVTDSGGAIFSFGSGSSLTLTQCTLSGNSARQGTGGAILALGRLTLRHCTISTNTARQSGGGVTCVNGPLILENSIIAGNTATDFPSSSDIYDQAATTLNGANIIQNISQDLLSGPGSSHGAITSDPLLAPLGDYGGATFTMALRPGSPARDAALNSTETRDQRDLPMVSTADIGAYEAGNALSTNRAAYLWETLPATAAPSSIAAEADFDGDGATNGDEWTALTDPNNPNSLLRGTITRVGANLTVSFPSIGGRSYTLWQSDSLATGSYTDTGTPAIPGNGSIQTFTIPLPDTRLFPRRFYAVRVAAP